MQYQYSDLIAISDTQEILDSFYSIHGIAAEILDLDSQIIVVSSGNTLCDEFPRDIYPAQPFIEQSEEDLSFQGDHRSARRYSYLGEIYQYARDIRVENRPIATLMLGPVFHAPPDEARFRLLAQEHGLDEAAYLKAVRRLPIVSEGQVERCVAFLISLIQRLAEKGFNQLRLAEMLAATKDDHKKLQQSYRDLESRIQERTEELEMANAALQESEQRFRVALVDTPVIVFNQDLELRYTWVYNSQDYAEQPIVGKTDAELFPKEDALRLSALKRRVIAAGLLTREEVSMTVGDGYWPQRA